MTTHIVVFQPSGKTVRVPFGTLVLEAAQQAGLEVAVPCGGQGRCGRCAVIVDGGHVRRRSNLRLAPADLARGYALACQTVIEGDTQITLLPQEKVERRLTTDRTALDSQPPAGYDPVRDQALRAFYLVLEPPSLADQTDDWSRLQTALRRQHGVGALRADLAVLRNLGGVLRSADWQVTAILEMDTWQQPGGPARLLAVLPGDRAARLLGAALDIGTTSNVVYLVDLTTGRVLARAVDYNGQIARGEDIISRIIYAEKNNGLAELQNLVMGTFNRLLEQAAQRARVRTDEIYKAAVAGNSTMIHLFLGLPPQSIRLAPFITAVNQPPPVLACELGLNIHPQASVDCLPGVASYVGSDITAGAVSSGLVETEQLTLFLDVGTNGETVLGNRDWLLSCACSAGPAFEGAGVEHGMRATTGAIEEVWINSQTHEPTYRVIGNGPPAGICGSGLISLLAELFITGVIDRGGNLHLTVREDSGKDKGGSRRDAETQREEECGGGAVVGVHRPRVRIGEHGAEYVVAWGGETATGRDIVLTKVDIDNLLRAKAAIYAGYTVLCQSVGVDPGDVEQVLIGGAFGQYINIEKAVQTGLLPDLPWDRFQFLGNTAVKGAYLALLSRDARRHIAEAAGRMTYLELSADNTFYHNFTSALFLPHTEIARFPSVQAVLEKGRR
jgi:uncharacterized 2Fe-2S/4Fe-4S cluster protein (DUF4445 family)